MKKIEKKEIKDLFFGWSQQVLQEDRFEKCRNVITGAHYVRAYNDWKMVQNECLKAVNDKRYTFQAELMKTSQRRENLIQLLNIKNKEIIQNIRSGNL